MIERQGAPAGPARKGPARARPRSAEGVRTLSRWMFHTHLWFGIITTGIVMVIAITGILLNHKRGLGLMPDVENTPSAVFDAALPLAELARRAQAAVGPDVAAAGVDRMDVRPGDNVVKVRFNDRAVTEATVELGSGDVLHVGERNDVFLEKLHSGEIFGSRWVLLSDAGAVGLALLIITGYWIWLYPRSRV